ncbi:MAG: ribosome maturation factor RimM [Thermoanaerobacteraceae bacterium]|nr:ribosome maturation factor RimM [Thermoanaerobacteraceae bacterium]
MNELLTIGEITSAHGINGEIKVLPLTNAPERFYDLSFVYISKNQCITKHCIENIRFLKNSVIIKFKNINNRNDAEKLRGCLIKIDEKDAIALKKDEYFIKDLINMDVYLEDGNFFGKITEVIQTGANDVYVVKTNDRSVLLPAIKQVIKKVNVDENKMIIHLLEGL